MDEKKRKKKEGTSAPHPLNYEDILNGFAKDEEPPPKSTEASRTDLDGLALAELLGEESRSFSDVGPASGHFDAIGVSDYSELARQFEKIDLSSISAEMTRKTAADSPVPTEEEKIPDDFPSLPEETKTDEENVSPDEAMGYAALLDQLETEVEIKTDRQADMGTAEFMAIIEEEQAAPLDQLDTEANTEEEQPSDTRTAEFAAIPTNEQEESEGLDWNLLSKPGPVESEQPEEPETHLTAPSKPEILSIVNLAENMDTTSGVPAIEENTAPSLVESSAPETEGLDLSDLFDEEMKTSGMDGAETAILPKQEPNASPPLETAQTGVDFLGLTGIAPPKDRSPGKTARGMEVLFEGVEMNFEAQTDAVTLAELLLAQGKKKEAAELFQQISQNKGATFWVAKRLRSLSASTEK